MDESAKSAASSGDAVQKVTEAAANIALDVCICANIVIDVYV